ncbi:hypothetical protein [Longimicrobium sp.]|jgi:hypothetical protein|uniref:PD-(D/E)XK nuclease domain-containing protein n=1 Tax=Longimicrobium sp. TaxID=2029185 RepID=UPI002ED83801
MPTDQRLLHALALAAKEYTLRTIKDLFVLAGAQPNWKRDIELPAAGQRESAFYGWIEGISAEAPSQLDSIVGGVLTQMLENQALSQSTRAALQRFATNAPAEPPGEVDFPSDVQRLLDRLITGLRRAEFPLKQRRQGKPIIELLDEYDVQDLLHCLLRPWIKDIRPEEYTPSYALNSTRIDFVLPEHRIALEVKFVRSEAHAKKVGSELIIDVAHYANHPDVDQLWIVVFDPSGYVMNPRGLRDLSGTHVQNGRSVQVSSRVVGGHHSPGVVNE